MVLKLGVTFFKDNAKVDLLSVYIFKGALNLNLYS